MLEVRPGFNIMIFEHVLWLEIFICYELSAARLQPSTGRYKMTRITNKVVYNYRLTPTLRLTNYNDRK